jgi:serine/threonine protein phosphatase 1
MLRWIEAKPDNVKLLMGNHDKEFAYNVQLMKMVIEKSGLNVDVNSLEHTAAIYKLAAQLARGKDGTSFFDYYGTMRQLIGKNGVTLADFMKWEAIISDFPYYYRTHIADRDCVVVHAGYIESLAGVETEDYFSSVEDFYIYARDDAYIYGGIPHGMIIAGHTPTTVEQELPFNDGNVYRSYDKEMDCIFYDIDCGCAFRQIHPNAKLACIRLEDEDVFYV